MACKDCIMRASAQVHWNFFFTIAVVSVVATMADLKAHSAGIAGCICLVVHHQMRNRNPKNT
eukprot:6234728-Amphidinium_carterae.1